GLIWEISATIEGSEGRQPTQEEIHDYLLKAQDDLTAHLVAQEITKPYDEYISLLVEELSELAGIAAVHGWKSSRYEAGIKAREAIHAIKSKWGIE
ncbi:MAG: hypothetical protein RBS96_07260, partial [Dehalococcoidales bacterium]|nr:hypothetical protein [Dehalococcoidales bacterium]